MRRIDSLLKRYYRQIYAMLPCGRKLKREVLSQLQGSIREYIEQNPQADFTAVQNRFGSPEQIAAGYVDDQSSEVLIKRMQLKKRVISIIACAVAVIVLIWGVAVLWAAWDSAIDRSEYVEVGIEKPDS